MTAGRDRTLAHPRPPTPGQVGAARDALLRIAHDLRWTWHEGALALFHDLDPDAWEASGHNPERLLGRLPDGRLAEVLARESFATRLDLVVAQFAAIRSSDGGWFPETHPGLRLEVALFAAEFGLADALPISAGGLGAVAGEEAMPVWDETLPPGPVVSSRLAIHDEEDDSYTMVSVRTSSIVARVLASRMLLTPDPGPDDLLDAVGELGNIAGGNVKSLLRHSCRLSLPTAEVSERAGDATEHGGVTVRAQVLGQVVELTVDVATDVSGLYWPGATGVPSAMESQS